MSWITTILDKDQQLFIYLNHLGSENWDGFWLTITDKYTWIPLYFVLLFLLYWFFGWRKALVLVLITAVLVAFTDQFVNLIKYSTHRLRPNRDPAIRDIIRVLKNSGGFSFVSGHATNSFAVATFMILHLRKHFKFIFLVLVWPILFLYSRIYVGVHYPIDLFFGMLLGIVIGISFYKISLLILQKLKKDSRFKI